jgi:transcriptional regulator with XRE-family HTH domain
MKEPGIAAFVREKRTALGWTQTVLAEKTGISRARVSQIEGGAVTLPGADHRRRLAQALGVSHLDLLVAAGEITEDEIGQAGAVGVVERGPITIADQIVDCVTTVNWEMFPGLANSILTTLTGMIEDQAKLRRRETER